MLPWGQLVIIQLAMYSVISHLESVHMVIKWGCEAMKLNCLSYHCYLVVVQQEWQPSFFGAVWFLITDTYLFSGAFTVAAVALIGQIHISYSYFLPQWYSEAAVVLFIPLVICVCHMHSSLFAFINQFIIAVRSCAPPSSLLSLWWALYFAWSLWRHWSGDIKVYEACDGMCHRCIYSTVCVHMLFAT